MELKQISFTRVNGVGWRVVNESNELNETAVSAFSKIQNGNTKSPVFDKEDAEKKITVELTVDEDSDSVFFTRIKSDSGVDEAGRSIMFANGFVGSLYEFVRDPLSLLCIDTSNYRFSIEETVDMPSTIVMKDKFSLKDAIDSVGFTEEDFHLFARSIYYVVTGNSMNSTIQIVCDCTEETMAKYMFIIYKLLPCELRKKVTFSSYMTQMSFPKLILFTRTLKDKNIPYIDINKHRMNVIGADVDDELKARYKFIDTAANNCWESGSSDGLFRDIEDQLKLFGIRETSDLYLYRVASNYLRFLQTPAGEHKPKVLTSRLHELLNIPNPNAYVDEQIQNVFSEIVKYNVEVSEKLSNKIMKRIAKTDNQELKESGSRFVCNTMLAMSPEEAAKNLYDNYPDKGGADFQRIENILMESSEGQAIIDHMWVFAAEAVPATREGIIDFYQATETVTNRSTVETALKSIVMRYIDEVSKKNNDIKSVTDEVNDLIGEISLEKYREEINNSIKRGFWDNFKFSKYENESFEHLYDEINECLIDENDKCHAFGLMAGIIDKFHYCQPNKMKESITDLTKLVNKEDRVSIGKIVLRSGANYARETVVNRVRYVDCFFACFEEFDIQDINLATYMIENNIVQFTDYMEELVGHSEYLCREDFSKRVIEWLSTCGHEKTISGKSVDELIEIIEESLKPKKKGFFGLF